MENVENMENSVNPEETLQEEAFSVVGNGVNSVDDGNDIGETEIYREGEPCEDGADEEAILSELRQFSGIEYGNLEEFDGYQRYLELRNSGILTAEEAFHAVNRGKTANNTDATEKRSGDFGSSVGGSKGHMTVSRRKPSSGEVFTRADREELAKWGITATGSELERLWRGASNR